MENTNTTIKYFNTNFLNVKVNGKNVIGGISSWQGIRKLTDTNLVNVGTTYPTTLTGQGFIYIGNIQCNSGNMYYLSVPKYKYTSIYGPDYNTDTGLFTFVGSCSNGNGDIYGFVYNGKLNHIDHKNNYSFPSVNKINNTTFVHSSMNGYMVGNSGDTNTKNAISFLYNINDLTTYIPVKFPGALTTTTYGIWYNGGTSYTLAGGASKIGQVPINNIYQDGLPTVYPFENGFLVDFDSKTSKFTNWTIIDYTKLGFTREQFLHIEGISGLNNNPNLFSLSVTVLNDVKLEGFYVTVARNNRSFDVTNSMRLKYSEGLTTANSVVDNKVVGINVKPGKTISYQSEIIFNDNSSGIVLPTQKKIINNENVIFNKQFVDGNISVSKSGVFKFKNEGLYNINFTIYLQNLNLPAAIFTIHYTVNGKKSKFIIEQKGIDKNGTGTAHGLSIPCAFSNKFFPNDVLRVTNTSSGDLTLVSNYDKEAVGGIISINLLNL
jgi:hypothetical protein